ncbi:FH2 domain-containing protein 1 [Chiloscyllium plagiosum]|uniref:FH2 domain-containing protein 1 n=1 Tax=Chiloscyllium plagiosum TaxID=36176 RepID=UPI001CB85731|nr:FH2 domain-containing protein 1 [Chiloscyllium plagiosum]
MTTEMTMATKCAESIELSAPSPHSPSTPFPSIHNVSTPPSQKKNHPVVLPPPPPPPPPPVLPPPPPPPSLLCQSHSSPSLQKSKFKKVNWITIPKDRILGKNNIWTMDKYDDDFQLDTLIMEKLFEQVEKVSGHERKHWRRSKHNYRDSTGERISLLDSRRSMNVGIFLKQFKRSVWEIVEDIKQGTAERYGAEELNKLLKLLPEAEEVKRLKRFEGDQSKLSEADLFMLLLVRVPSYCLHLEAMILKDEFEPQIKSLMTSVCTMIKAAHELRNCDELHAILRLVLKAGNHMNAGGYSGNAAGFRIASLLKLADIKANKPGMNLIHFVAMEAEKMDQKLLSFPDKLEHIGAAARLSEDGIQEELNKLSERVASLQTDLNEDSELEAQIAPFLQTAKEKLKEIWKTMEFFQRMRQSLVEYFCEDEKFKLEEYCTVLKGFCEKFLKAIQENATREIEQLKKQQREKEMEAKRHSVATCSSIEIELGQDDLAISLARNLQSHSMKRSERRSFKPDSLSKEHCTEKTYPSGGIIEIEQDCDINDLSSDFREKEQANLLRKVSEKVLKQQLGHCIMQVGYPILKGANILNQEAETNKEMVKPAQELGESEQSLPFIKECPKLKHTVECRTPNKSQKSSENFPLKKSHPSHCSKWNREEQREEQNAATKRKQFHLSSSTSKKTFGGVKTRVDQKDQFAKKPTAELSKVESGNLITNRKNKTSTNSTNIQPSQCLKGQRTASSLHKGHTSEKPISSLPTSICKNLLSPGQRKSITSGIKQVTKVKEIKQTPTVPEQATSPKSLSKSDSGTSGSRIPYAKQSLQLKKLNPGTDTMVKHQTDSLISKGMGQRSRSLKLNRQPVWR